MPDQVVTPAANASASEAAKVAAETPAAAAAAAKVEAKPADAVAATPAASDKPVVTPDPAAKTPTPDAPKVEAAATEKYELKLPEGSKLDPKRVEAITEFAKQNKLSNAQAQDILAQEHEVLNGHIQAHQTAMKTQADKWLAEVHADKDLGGDNFKESVALAHRGMTEFFPGVDIKLFMDETGLGNNPAILKGFKAIGKLLSNDKIIPAPGGGPAPKKSLEERLYNNASSK